MDLDKVVDNSKSCLAAPKENQGQLSKELPSYVVDWSELRKLIK